MEPPKKVALQPCAVGMKIVREELVRLETQVLFIPISLSFFSFLRLFDF